MKGTKAICRTYKGVLMLFNGYDTFVPFVSFVVQSPRLPDHLD
jgi:hypothetical protein